MRELITAIRSGKVNLKPRKVGGWYDHQVYALETLLLPEKGAEANKLLLTKILQEADARGVPGPDDEASGDAHPAGLGGGGGDGGADRGAVLGHAEAPGRAEPDLLPPDRPVVRVPGELPRIDARASRRSSRSRGSAKGASGSWTSTPNSAGCATSSTAWRS